MQGSCQREESQTGLNYPERRRGSRWIFKSTANIPPHHCGSRMIRQKNILYFFECPRRSAVTMVIWSFGQNRFRSVKSSTIINILYLYIVSKWPNPRMKMTILTLTTLTGILGETCILAYILCYVFVYTKMSQSIIVKILSQNSIIMFIYVKYWLCEQNFIVNVCLFEKSDSSLHWKDFEIIRIWVKS